MPRFSDNPNWIRFHLILKFAYMQLHPQTLSQPEFIAGCYDWIEAFADIWEKNRSREDYASWLIDRGIGSGVAGTPVIVGINSPHGLPNNRENRKKAAARLQQSLADVLTEEKLSSLNAALLDYLAAGGKEGYAAACLRSTAKLDPRSFGAYIRSYLLPALWQIEAPFERFAAVLIYAQSGSIPLDVQEEALADCRARMQALELQLAQLCTRAGQTPSDIYRSDDFRELDDPRFCGTFYGYFRQFRSPDGKTGYQGLTPFELTLRYDEADGASASFSFFRCNPSQQAVPILMTGKPMRGRDTIHIVLQGQTGDDLVTMCYRWIRLRNGALQARQGVMITLDRFNQCPQVQQFVFFHRPVAKEQERYVDAFLRMCGDRFTVSSAALSDLSAGALRLLEQYGKPLRGYRVSARQALSQAQEEGQNQFQTVRALLELMEYSESPLLIQTGEDPAIIDFFRALPEQAAAPQPDSEQL